MDNASLVPVSSEHASPSFKTRPISESPLNSSRQTRRLSPSSQEIATFSGEFIRPAISSLGLSTSTTDLICKSWRSTTRSQYDSILRGWCRFCAREQLHPTSPSINNILDYLTQLHDKGLQYNTIASAKSVLSGIIHIPGVTSILDHPLVIRLLKGVFNSNPPKPRYNYIWDASLVINYLASLHNEDSNFKMLSLKLVTLFTLLSGQRVSTLRKFKGSCMQELPGRLVFHVNELFKQSNPNNLPKPVIFHAFSHKPTIVSCDFKELSKNTMRWRYQDNIDIVRNHHGNLLLGLCEKLKILPLNHCKYYNKDYDGGFTFYKANRKSQIDMGFTNNEGRKIVKEFKLIREGWHLSDHIPIEMKLEIPKIINTKALLTRAEELNHHGPVQQPKINSYAYKFDMEQARRKLTSVCSTIRDVCNNAESGDAIIDTLNDALIPIIKSTRIKQNTVAQNVNHNGDIQEKCDELFKIYTGTKDDDEEGKAHNYRRYQEERNKINKLTLKKIESKYDNILNSKDDKKLWQRIDWSGNYNRREPANQPAIREMANHFEELYSPIDKNEDVEIKALRSTVTIPINDDSITKDELSTAVKNMKKGGYDYSLGVLSLIISCLTMSLLNLLNIMFFFTYPLSLALSILTAIPKKGNMSLVTNYRGIQMQPLLGILYDRIIAQRLLTWAKISPEQSAFQKGKSTINQVFVLRIIIALAKRYKNCLYIAFFDLSKAFDKVSRLLLLKSLLKMGVGMCLFEAIKNMYLVTKCVLKSSNKLSDVFYTYTGIKQGAPSSVVLFIIFMDDVIDLLKSKCINEEVLQDLHSLFHADDTVVISMQRELFIHKCNILLKGFKEKKLTTNWSKSSYFIINGGKEDHKVDIKLTAGWLSYQSTYVYLGVIITDQATVKSHDFLQQMKEKSKVVNIKLSNFMYNQYHAPVKVKIKVLKTCVNTSLLYACETWSDISLKKLETLNRMAIKLTCKIKKKTPNNILYTETGLGMLTPTVYKCQYKFWEKIKKSIEDDPASPISKVITLALNNDIPYLKHYRKLHDTFSNAENCYEFYTKSFWEKVTTTIKNVAVTDDEGNCGVYLKINPTLKSPELYSKYICVESDRMILSKYRSGSHDLRIRTGRFEGLQRDMRKCLCDNIQTLSHVIFDCPLTECVRVRYVTNNLEEFFSDIKKAADCLRQIESILKIRRY